MLVCIPGGDDNVGDDEIDDDGVETEEVVDGLSRTERRLMCDGSPLCGVPGIMPSLKEIIRSGHLHFRPNAFPWEY